MDNQEAAISIFLAGIRGVMPERLIRRSLSVTGSSIRIGDRDFDTGSQGRIFVIGAGKASAAMAHYVEAILGDRISGGHVVVKYGHACKLRYIEVTEAGHPVPDNNGFRATSEILRIAREAGENDIVICLLSGGGSALLTDIPEGLIPEDIAVLNSVLVRGGVPIGEMNTVRKHLSGIKGGQLSKAVLPARVITLVLSDVPGNSLDVIASGPTAPDNSSYADALRILGEYGLISDITTGVVRHLEEGINGLKPETPGDGDPAFDNTYNFICGTNMTALEAAREEALLLGFNTMILGEELTGDAVAAADYLVETALRIKNDRDVVKPACILAGGETTLRVTGLGEGGRNQHLALVAANRLRNSPGITLLAGGTDGNDGPTDAAGAVVSSETFSRAISSHIDPEKYIRDFDSTNFFRIAGGHVITGPTMTNVMDMVVIIVDE